MDNQQPRRVPSSQGVCRYDGPSGIRDRHGNRIGEIEINGSKRILRDKAGNRLGEYDSQSDQTRDKYGNPVGQGDLLTTLLR